MSWMSELLGADAENPKDFYVTVVVPSQTRDGDKIDHEYWRRETVRALSELFGGATSVSGFGGWLDVERGGQIKEEEISMVVSFMAENEWNKGNGLTLRKFLSRMGREAQQGAVGIIVLGEFIEFKADSYDK